MSLRYLFFGGLCSITTAKGTRNHGSFDDTFNGLAPPALDELCINTLRFLAVDMVQKANSGHPGSAPGLGGHGLRTLGSLAQVQPE